MLAPASTMMESRSSVLPPGRSGRAILEFVKYFLVSALALGIDWGLLVFLTKIGGFGYLASAAIGYSTGLVVGYGLSVTFVFAERRLAEPLKEFLVFAGIGLLGLALTQVAMAGLVEIAHLPYDLAKGPTACLVFMFNFTLRRAVLFSVAQRTDEGIAR